MSDHETNTAPAELVRALAHFEDTVRRHLCGDRSGAAVAAARAAVLALAAPVPAAQTPPIGGSHWGESVPAAQGAVDGPDHKQLQAMRDAAESTASEDYFRLRPQADGSYGRKLFHDAFSRGFYSGWAARANYIASVPAAPSQVCAASPPGLEGSSPGLAAQGAIAQWQRRELLDEGTEDEGWSKWRPVDDADASDNAAWLLRRPGKREVRPLYATPVGQAEDAARWRKLTSYRTLSTDDAHWNGPRRKEDADAWIDGIPARQAVQSEPGDAK